MDSLNFVLVPEISLKSHLVSIDSHIHTWSIDGSSSPETVARSARAEGLSCIFITDDDPKLTEHLTNQNNQEGLLVLPGQEIATDSFHINALNTVAQIACPGPDPRTDVNHVIAECEGQSSSDRPVALILNHPHSEFSEGAREYFHTWWIVDEFQTISAVENFNFASWFRRLNTGRRLAAIWNTDSHDAYLYPPGARRTCVYAPQDASVDSIMKAYLAGNSYCTRAPGAMLDVLVNGRRPGEEVYVAADKPQVRVQISCAAQVPLEALKLVWCGKVADCRENIGTTTFDYEALLPIPHSGWLVVMLYGKEPPRGCCSHEMEPLTRSGVLAFSNPVYITTRPELREEETLWQRPGSKQEVGKCLCGV